MLESSRVQGGLICAGAAITALVFGLGLLAGSWWAVAIPVGILLAFVLGLTFWVGWTIATVDVEPELEAREAETAEEPGAPVAETRPNDGAA